MNTIMLDSPIEALAFNYFSFGFFAIVNNLWPWLAVLTAAFSVWRIRATGVATSCIKSNPPPPSCTGSNSTESPPISDISPPETAEAEEPPAASSTAVSASTSASFYAVEHVATKRKFIEYYYENESESESEVKVGGELENDDESDGCRDWWESWERVLRMRRGDMEWYRFQDWTSLNGNVVRLWDGHGCIIN